MFGIFFYFFLLGACLMLLVDFREPDLVLKEVDWSLLVFFSSLFIVVRGFGATGLPADAWNEAKNSINVNTTSGIILYTILILIGSNTVSNVPLVLLFGPSIPTLHNPTHAWLLLSFVSTVAGNLTLVGSVANLIVAARAKLYYRLEFIEYATFGTPSTIVVTIVGVCLVTWLV
jgi:Na+/H+ antiporter NhaD/arsenite permease-like protein